MSIVDLSLSGGVFILAIAVFRGLTLRRLPKGTFVALWWLAAARLLIPAAVPSPFSVYTLLASLGTRAEEPAIPAIPAVPAVPPAAAAPVQVIPGGPEAAPSAPFPIWTVLWLSVGTLLALLFLIRYVRWRQRFRESLPADCPGLETWRRVRLRVSDRITAPLTYGLFRPVILLPKTLDLSDEEAVTCVLAHETVHIRHLDGLLKLALTAALCVHWFNPAVWLLCVLGNRDMELRCDEAAVLALGEDSRERYALVLLRLAEKQCVPLCGFAHRSGMEERIRAIMSVKKKSLLACVLALALVLGITTAFATSAKPADGPSEADASGYEDMTDLQLHAQSSAESAAQWEEVLAPYEPFGLEWTFDDPDLDGNGLSMTWEGHEVRGIYDEIEGLWITEHTGNSAYGPGAVELYAVYEGGRLNGLRLATEAEQKEFDRHRNLSADAQKTVALGDSVRYDSGNIYFTIPESDKPWSIFIQGRVLMEDGSGMSVHYLEDESEQGEWIPRMTYSFEVGDAAFDELTMDIKYGNATYCYPLTLLLPEGKPLAQDPLPEEKAEIPEDDTLLWPVDSDRITSEYGSRANPGGESAVTHGGVDIGGLERGAPVYAAAAGTVDAAGYESGAGNYVVLTHGNGMATIYAHCDTLLVKQGDTVKKGQTIATIGSTGQSTGPHLHFEVQVSGENRNPLEFFPYRDVARNVSGAPWTGEGYPVYAVDSGFVSDFGWDEEYGYYVEITQSDTVDHRPNSVTRYSHCGAIHVKQGEQVEQGTLIANEGVDPLQVEYDVEDPIYMIRRQEELTAAWLVDGDYPRNSKGQTYGPDLSWITGTRPDLERVSVADGEEGYVNWDDRGERHWNAETEKWECEGCQVLANGFHYIPLYNREGEKTGDLYRTWCA